MGKKYAVMSFRGVPSVVFIEHEDRVTMHSGNEEEDEREASLYREVGITTIGAAIGSGYSYHDGEFGEYAGADKARVDEIIAALPGPSDDR